ncbi:MAG: PEP-CTERM sorting domain-containing protein [Verrucomicrobiota bacterium]
MFRLFWISVAGRNGLLGFSERCRCVVVALGLAALMGGWVPSASGQWFFDVIEFDTVTGEEGDGGGLKENASIAVDTLGNPHVAFTTEGDLVQELVYAFWDGADWQSSTIIGDAIVPSLTLNSIDQAHVSFTGGITGGLGHAFRGLSGLWTVTEVDGSASGIRPGSFSSIALDPIENPVISSQTVLTGGTPGAELRFASVGGTAFTNVRVDPATIGGGASADPTADTGWYTSIEVDSGSGFSRISYYDAGSGDLRFATQTGASTWSTETVDATGDVGQFSSLELDSSGNAHIGYYSTTGEVKLAAWNGTTWDIETVASGLTASPDHLTLALDGSDGRHITYLSSNGDGTSSVIYGFDGGSGWSLETVAGNAISSSLDGEVDGGGAHLVYENNSGELIYATNVASVPEPTAGVLLMVAGLAAVGRRRKRSRG